MVTWYCNVKKTQASRQKTVLFGFSTAFIQTDIKWLSAGFYWNMLRSIIFHIFSTSLNWISQFADGIKLSLSSEMPERGWGGGMPKVTVSGWKRAWMSSRGKGNQLKGQEKCTIGGPWNDSSKQPFTKQEWRGCRYGNVPCEISSQCCWQLNDRHQQVSWKPKNLLLPVFKTMVYLHLGQHLQNWPLQ